MAEVFVDVKSTEEWRKGLTRDRLIEEMDARLSAIPGVNPAFSQPIRDNVLESISQIKGQIVVKVSGDDLHMLRDTFAVEYLLAGMPLEEVSRLLGHSSVVITEKHYAPWVLERQQRLAANQRAAWTMSAAGTPQISAARVGVHSRTMSRNAAKPLPRK